MYRSRSAGDPSTPVLSLVAKDDAPIAAPAPEGSIVEVQRLVLERLIELTAAQACALDNGDLVLLTSLTEVRSKLVRDALGYLPPGRPWEAELVELVESQQQRSAALQLAIRSCMAAVKRELLALTKGEQAVHYLAGGLAQQGTSWKG